MSAWSWLASLVLPGGRALLLLDPAASPGWTWRSGAVLQKREPRVAM